MFVWTLITVRIEKFAGFEWDVGNRSKCQKHGVSLQEIEGVVTGNPAIEADPSPAEPRFRAIGKTPAGRYMFLVFTLRRRAGAVWLRRISARYMHEKEIAWYEEKNPHLQE